jgi:Ras-related protein Rab-1A
MSDYDYLFKLILLGDSSVGKSSILYRFTDDDFAETQSTIGVDFKIKTIVVNDHICKLQVWDTSGQCKFRAITRSYYRGAHGIILVYDVTNRSSFENLDYWLNEIKIYASPDVNIIIVGNKNDLVSRDVLTEEGIEFAESRGLTFIETSAKMGICVDDVFSNISSEIQTITNNLQKSMITSGNIICDSEPSTSTSGYCCY